MGDPASLQDPIEDQRWIAFVDPELSSDESAFLCNPNRGVMLWVNQASHQRRSKVLTSPIQRCLHRLGRIAQPVLRWFEYPSHFYGSKRRLYLSLGV
jgi:hypothetical protein